MSVIRMSTDIRPLCSLHRESVMTPILVRCYFPGERYSSIAAFACEEPGCGRHYNIIHGYFEVPDGRISPIQNEISARCPIDESPMHLAGIAADGTRTYQCSQAGCDGSCHLNPYGGHP